MIRIRSTDVWFNAPGIQAAYQPIGAPDSFTARQNIGNDGRLAGRHTPMPGVLPTHDSRRGWAFNGTQYFTTTVFASTPWSALVQFSDSVADNGNRGLLGGWAGSTNFAIWQDSGGASYYLNTNFVGTTRITAGSLGIAGQTGYKNGIRDKTLTGTPGSGAQVFIGSVRARNDYCIAIISTVLISSVTLSPVHMWQYSRQIAYCHLNPDWSAWGRRRRYFYAPSAAAGRVGIYGARGAVALPGGVRIGTVNDA